MIATAGLVNICDLTITAISFCGENIKSYSLSSFQGCNKVLLTTIILLYFRIPKICLYNNQKFVPFDRHLPDYLFPVPWNYHSTFYFFGFSRLSFHIQVISYSNRISLISFIIMLPNSINSCCKCQDFLLSHDGAIVHCLYVFDYTTFSLFIHPLIWTFRLLLYLSSCE